MGFYIGLLSNHSQVNSAGYETCVVVSKETKVIASIHNRNHFVCRAVFLASNAKVFLQRRNV